MLNRSKPHPMRPFDGVFLPNVWQNQQEWQFFVCRV